MRKKLLLLAFALLALTGSLMVTSAEAGGGETHSCPICTYYAHKPPCCVPCICNEDNEIIACTNLMCPPA